ncbi:MAG: rhodanese-like domain-containing protein [Nocardioidaceae bacterium]|nr:rhodanese-like domain-containing protein [Nocardioidaceae bacterium]
MARRAGAAACVTALLLTATGCAGSDAEPRPVATDATATPAPSSLVGSDAFEAAVAEPGRVTINVHVPFEGSIRGTDVTVPYNTVERAAGELPSVGTPLAIYCRSGSMSAEAAPVLTAMGYDDIVELDGGMTAWVDDGRGLLRER